MPYKICHTISSPTVSKVIIVSMNVFEEYLFSSRIAWERLIFPLHVQWVFVVLQMPLALCQWRDYISFLILCLKQAVLKQHKKKPTLFQQKESWDHLHAQKLIWHRISNRKKLVAFIKIEVIMICGFSLGSMLQFLLLSEMLCIPAQGDSFTKTYNILEEDYMEIR